MHCHYLLLELGSQTKTKTIFGLSPKEKKRREKFNYSPLPHYKKFDISPHGYDNGYCSHVAILLRGRLPTSLFCHGDNPPHSEIFNVGN